MDATPHTSSPDPIAAKARQLAAVQIGDLVLNLCEAHAKIDVLLERIEKVTRAYEALEQAKQEG